MFRLFLLLSIALASGEKVSELRKANILYPVELLAPVTGKYFEANVTRDRLLCFGNRDYTDPTYLNTFVCLVQLIVPIFEYDCESIFGSRFVNIETKGHVELLRVQKLPEESHFNEPISINATRWIESYDDHKITNLKEKLIPAEPVYLCARSNDWKYSFSSLSSLSASAISSFKIIFSTSSVRVMDRLSSLRLLLAHLVLLTLASSRLLLPYLLAMACGLWVHSEGMKLYSPALLLSLLVLCFTPLMIKKSNWRGALLYIRYFVRGHAEDTKSVITDRLPLLQSIFFSSLLLVMGSLFTYFLYRSLDHINRERRNQCLVIFLTISSSWLVFFFCRSFDRFVRSWIWLFMSFCLARLFDEFVNPLAKGEVIMATMIITYVYKMILVNFIVYIKLKKHWYNKYIHSVMESYTFFRSVSFFDVLLIILQFYPLPNHKKSSKTVDEQREDSVKIVDEAFMSNAKNDNLSIIGSKSRSISPFPKRDSSEESKHVLKEESDFQDEYLLDTFGEFNVPSSSSQNKIKNESKDLSSCGSDDIHNFNVNSVKLNNIKNIIKEKLFETEDEEEDEESDDGVCLEDIFSVASSDGLETKSSTQVNTLKSSDFRNDGGNDHLRKSRHNSDDFLTNVQQSLYENSIYKLLEDPQEQEQELGIYDLSSHPNKQQLTNKKVSHSNLPTQSKIKSRVESNDYFLPNSQYNSPRPNSNVNINIFGPLSIKGNVFSMVVQNFASDNLTGGGLSTVASIGCELSGGLVLTKTLGPETINFGRHAKDQQHSETQEVLIIHMRNAIAAVNFAEWAKNSKLDAECPSCFSQSQSQSSSDPFTSLKILLSGCSVILSIVFTFEVNSIDGDRKSVSNLELMSCSQKLESTIRNYYNTSVNSEDLRCIEWSARLPFLISTCFQASLLNRDNRIILLTTGLSESALHENNIVVDDLLLVHKKFFPSLSISSNGINYHGICFLKNCLMNYLQILGLSPLLCESLDGSHIDLDFNKTNVEFQVSVTLSLKMSLFDYYLVCGSQKYSEIGNVNLEYENLITEPHLIFYNKFMGLSQNDSQQFKYYAGDELTERLGACVLMCYLGQIILLAKQNKVKNVM